MNDIIKTSEQVRADLDKAAATAWERQRLQDLQLAITIIHRFEEFRDELSATLFGSNDLLHSDVYRDAQELLTALEHCTLSLRASESGR